MYKKHFILVLALGLTLTIFGQIKAAPTSSSVEEKEEEEVVSSPETATLTEVTASRDTREAATDDNSDNEQPTPYNYTFEEKDANFTITRQEEMDEKGVVKGSYSYVDKDGLFRTVNYIADDDGFRATIDSNEPGLVSSAPSGVQYNVQ